MLVTLTATERSDFERDGFVTVRGLFDPGEIAEIRETFMAQAADGPVPGLSDMPRGQVSSSDPLARYPRMMHPHKHGDRAVGPLAMRYMLDPRLRPILAALFAEEPFAVQSMFYFKPPGARGQDLHQDNFYLKVKPGTCMAAWVAVDDADAGNGGMMCVPQTAGLDIACPEPSDPSLSFTTERVAPPAGQQALMMQLKAGDVLFFNGSVIHGSTPNTSPDRFRRSLIFHYVPASTVEMSHWYEALSFEGARQAIAVNADGGPCGTLAEPGPH